MILFIGFTLIVIAVVFSYALNESKKSIDESDPDSKPDKSYLHIIAVSTVIYIFFVVARTSEALALEEIAFIIILMPFIWLPIVLTGFNIRNLMKNNHTAIGIDMATIFIGGAYYLMLMSFMGDSVHGGITDKSYKNERETVFRTKTGEKLHKIMSTVSGMTKFSFMLILPIIIICEILYIIFGQGADGFIKAFTMTADWTFSTQTPPPPMEYQGHYLCTVAAGGHEKVVKPVRYGIRRNQKIIVNRQLLIANAFEDLIAERFPKSHRRIRNFYDKYGYPVSRHITTRTRADIVYIIMKPLEYIFLGVLYMFDVQPENRIAVQYSEYRK